MILKKEGNNLVLAGISDFDLAQSMECGQCFHFEQVGENEYGIVSGRHFLHARQLDDNMLCYDISEDEFMEYWWHYFDFERDYGEIKSAILKRDSGLAKAIEDKFGIHIFNQEFYEVLMSFIISQNKQIPHIKQIVRNISAGYGVKVGQIKDTEFYSFPDIDALSKISEDEYREMKTGFRARYLREAATKLASGETGPGLADLSYNEAKQNLMSITGVGEKVANCVMLFGLGFREAFPVDVWIKRIMEERFFDGKDVRKDVIEKFGIDLYGKYGGYAQQYMFSYGRENNTGKMKKQEKKSK